MNRYWESWLRWWAVQAGAGATAVFERQICNRMTYYVSKVVGRCFSRCCTAVPGYFLSGARGVWLECMGSHGTHFAGHFGSVGLRIWVQVECQAAQIICAQLPLPCDYLLLRAILVLHIAGTMALFQIAVDV